VTSNTKLQVQTISTSTKCATDLWNSHYVGDVASNICTSRVVQCNFVGVVVGEGDIQTTFDILCKVIKNTTTLPSMTKSVELSPWEMLKPWTVSANMNVSLPVSVAHRIHGGPSVLQHYRGPAAVVLGQCPQILCPAKLPWRDSPPAGISAPSPFHHTHVAITLWLILWIACVHSQAANSYLRDQWFHSIQWKVRSHVKKHRCNDIFHGLGVSVILSKDNTWQLIRAWLIWNMRRDMWRRQQISLSLNKTEIFPHLIIFGKSLYFYRWWKCCIYFYNIAIDFWTLLIKC